MAAASLKDATESAHNHSFWEELIPWRGSVVRQSISGYGRGCGENGKDPWEEETLIGIWQDKEGVKTEDMPLRYWLPEGKTYRDCYEENCCKDKEVRS